MTRGPTIGVLSPYVGGSYYGGILTGIARAASAIDGRVVAVQTVEAGSFHADSVGTSGFRDQVAWDHVGGFIVVANAVDSAYLDSLRTAGKSVVLVSNEAAGFSCPVVLPDNSGIRSAVAHLIEHGHRDIASSAACRCSTCGRGTTGTSRPCASTVSNPTRGWCSRRRTTTRRVATRPAST